jgi:hypothetical protein
VVQVHDALDESEPHTVALAVRIELLEETGHTNQLRVIIWS